MESITLGRVSILLVLVESINYSDLFIRNRKYALNFDNGA